MSKSEPIPFEINPRNNRPIVTIENIMLMMEAEGVLLEVMNDGSRYSHSSAMLKFPGCHKPLAAFSIAARMEMKTLIARHDLCGAYDHKGMIKAIIVRRVAAMEVQE